MSKFCFVTHVTGNRFYENAAEKHAQTTIKNHFRADASTWHVVSYDPATGQPHAKNTAQGYSDDSAWSRGQAWGVYGYTAMARETGERRYLDFARKLADYAIDHPDMPEDGVPYWDFGAPGEERDSSAGAILSSALLELAGFCAAPCAARYCSFAEKTLASLASPAYFSRGGEAGHFLLRHGGGYLRLRVPG